MSMYIYIYISPICNVVVSFFSVNIIKIRDSPFSFFTWYQSQKGKPNFFFGNRVSFWSLYSPFGTLRRCCRRQISSLSSTSDFLAASDFFQPALLRPETSDSEAHEADLHVGGTLPENNSPHATTCHSSLAAYLPCAGAWPTFR